jgi:hypothetical protein
MSSASFSYVLLFRARAELFAQLSRGASADPQRRIVDWSAQPCRQTSKR